MTSGSERWPLVAAGSLVLLLLASLLQKLFKPKRVLNRDELFPPGPLALPIIGHLHLLLSGCPQHTLSHLARKLGPIIGLRLGSQRAIVVSDAALARSILGTHDKIFANRPRLEASNTLFYGYDTAVIFSSYNPHWAMLRKFYTLELFTAKRLHELQYVRQDELRGLLHRIAQASHDGTHAIEVGQFVADMSSNTTSRLLQSKTLSNVGGEPMTELMHRLEAETSPTPGDFIPWLKCLDAFQKRSMKDLHECLDKVFDSIILERRQMMKACQPHEFPHDLLQVILSKQVANSDGELLTTQEIKGIMLDIFAGGVLTAASTVEWAMAELLRNPRCLGNLRDEIDANMGKGEKLVTDEDLPKLPYLLNTTKEVLRLHPVVPLLVPRMSSKACKVGKYTLPKNTQAFVNVYAIGRDPQVWEEAETFWPERFEGKEVDVRGQHYELLPFGAGRRMCPGLRLGLSVVQVTLANLVKAFDWELPNGQSPNSVDMSEKRGIGNVKATPVLAVPKPRLSSACVTAPNE